MRIHRLKITNLASLRGTHEIDFNQLVDGGNLFAITGATGAGKSTLMSAISLALYQNNHQSELTQADFITLGEKSGSVELSFEIESKLYRAIWKCRVRKTNGEKLARPKIERFIYDNEGNILEDKIENILKLDFDQFCKTIMLNQGQFSKFLKSSFSARKDILENLYHGQKITNMGIYLRAKIKEYTHKKESLIAQKDSLTPIIEEYGNTDRKQSPNYEERIKKLNFYAADLREIDKLLSELLILEEKSNTNAKRLDSETTRAKVIYDKLNNSKQDLSVKEETCKKSVEELNKQQPLLFKAIEKKKSIEAKTATTTNIIAKIAEHKKNITSIEQELAKLSANLKKLQTEEKAVEKEIGNGPHRDENKILNNINQIKFKLTELNKQKTHLQQQEINLLKNIHEAKSQLTKHPEIDELNKESKNNKDKLSHLQQQLIEYENNEEIINDLYSKLKSTNDQIEHSLDIIKKQNKEKELIEVKIPANMELMKNYIQKYQEKKMLEDIHQLSHDSGHCLICGNEEIPKEIYLKLPKSGDSDNNIKELERKVKIGEENTIHLENLKNTLRSRQEENKQVEDKRQDIKKQLWSLYIKLPKTENKPISSYSEFKSSYNQLREEITRTRAKLETITAQINIVSIITNDINNQTQQQNILGQTKRDLDSEIKLLELSFKNIRNESPGLEKETIEACIKILEKKIKNREKQKEIVNSINVLQLKIEHLSDACKSTKEQCSEQEKTKKELEQEIINIKSEIDLITNKQAPETLLEQLQQQAKSYETAYKLANTKIRQLEVDWSSVNTSLDLLNEQIREMNRLKTNYHNSLIDKINSLTRITLEDENLDNTDLSFVQSSLLKLGREELSINENKDIVEIIHKEHIQPYAEKIDSALESLKEEYYGIKSREKLINESEEKLSIIEADLNKLNDSLLRLQKIHEVVGKDEFRNYILGIIEKNLIIYTNKELKDLCDGRYEVYQVEKKQGHDFAVIDYFNNAETRKVHTLSGGETFLVSLAMSLALAEMTRGQTQIESFFIDEGFGTLDEDSIDDVYQVLMNIRNRGKQIGIISHVKALTSRIQANIHLEKNQFGNSEISYEYN